MKRDTVLDDRKLAKLVRAARKMRDALRDIEYACAIPDQNYKGVDLSTPPIVGGKVTQVERWIAARAAKGLKGTKRLLEEPRKRPTKARAKA